jgi:uncharacterized protein DUF4158
MTTERVLEIPPPIVLHIAKADWNQIPNGLSAYDASTARFRHMALVRSHMRVTPFADAARKLMSQTCLASSRVREYLADIVNMAIEESVRQRYELPGFSTLFRAARPARFAVNQGYYPRFIKQPSRLLTLTLPCFSTKIQLNGVVRGTASRPSQANPRSSGFESFLFIWTGYENRSLRQIR